jgi:hypothetical protein
MADDDTPFSIPLKQRGIFFSRGRGKEGGMMIVISNDEDDEIGDVGGAFVLNFSTILAYSVLLLFFRALCFCLLFLCRACCYVWCLSCCCVFTFLDFYYTAGLVCT